MDNRAVRTRTLPIKLAFSALLLVFNCLPSGAQTTVGAIKSRLLGQPLYLRGCWMDNHLKFNASGQPESNFRPGAFTEAGIDVRKVKLSHGRLQIEGQRIGLEFLNTVPERIKISSRNYDGSISVEIEAPPDGDFDKTLTAIFAPDLASLVPAMPSYWQGYARKHLLPPGPVDAANQKANTVAEDSKATSTDNQKPSHIGGAVMKPNVLHQAEPQFSGAARVLKFSGIVEVYLWVMPDGSPSHLKITKPAGLGLDEQAILAVSQYKFKPATKDGKPVMVDLYVDVNFQVIN